MLLTGKWNKPGVYTVEEFDPDPYMEQLNKCGLPWQIDADDIVFNSVNQVRKYGERAKECGKSIGLRVNPECSTQEGHAIYDPCAVGSRLGCTLSQLDESIIPMLDGLHFHTLCEQNSDDLETTAKAFEDKFGKYLHNMKWVNFGGGHHITREDYDIERLKRVITHFPR